MTKDQLNKLVASYIIAIGTTGAPNSHVWMAIDPSMSDLDSHQTMLMALTRADLIKETGYYLSLTEKGEQLHERISRILLALESKAPKSTPASESESTPS